MNNYSTPAITLVKGRGSIVTDADGKIYMVYGFYPLNPNIKIPAADLVEFDYHNGKIELFSLKDSIPELVASMDMIEILRYIPMIED